MENIKLSSENAKKYLVHALKGIGVGYENETNFKDMLGKGVDPETLYKEIIEAVRQRIERDYTTDRFAIRQGMFDAKTVSAMGKKLGDDFSKVVDNVASPSLPSLRLVSEMVIDIIKEGVSNQNYLTQQEKDEVCSELNKIRTALYEEHVVRNEDGSPKMDFDQYTIERLRTDVIQSVFEICGDEKEVFRILNTKVDQEMLTTLKANKSLKEFSDEFCHEFSVLQNGESKDNLRVVDVLMAMKHRSIGAHVVACFQARSKEQQEIVEQNPHTTEINKFNKIGNLVGKLKEEKVKDNTETSVVKSLKKDVKKKTKIAVVTSTDVGTALKEGKKGPWRGYKKLYDAVKGFMAKLYEPMMAIGFTQAMMKERNMWIDTETSNNQENRQKISIQDWKIDIQPIPNEYFEQQDQSKLNVAGEFYATTKARVLADKVLLLAKESENFSKEPGKRKEQIEEIDYLQQRIDTANLTLENKMPEKKSPDFVEEKYFKNLSDEILNKKNVKGGLKNFINTTDNNFKDANGYMTLAYYQFNKAYKNANTLPQKSAVRDMAVEIFHLQNHVNQGLISDQDLDALVDRFWKAGPVEWLNVSDAVENGVDNRKKTKNQQTDSISVTINDCKNIIRDSNYQEIKSFMGHDILKVKNFVELDLLNHSEKLKSDSEKDSEQETKQKQEARQQFEQSIIERKRSEILSSMGREM